jgi:hypothetical protein
MLSLLTLIVKIVVWRRLTSDIHTTYIYDIEEENIMHGRPMLYRDQYGNCFMARSVKELRDKVGGGRVSKMYNDLKSGETVHTGYVVGAHWCTAFQPVQNPA